LWSTGDTTPSITVTDWGVYTLLVDNGLCKQQFTFKAQPAALPVINNLEFSNGRLVISAINPNEFKPLEYSIDGGITWHDSNVFTEVQNNIMLFIKVRNKTTHCEVGIEFFTTHINNMITPNNDGYNDNVDLTNMVRFPGFKAAIYDRYGSPIFNFTEKTPIWNGTVGGKKLSTGTYWFEMNWAIGTVPAKQSGWILLKNRE
jgi:gliding motility-associated-like protein